MSIDLPAASLVIPSINRPRLLLETVESVLAGDEVPAEIIIVDQSTDPHEQLARLTTDLSELRYTRVQQAGVSRARNLGIRMATHPLVAFIDDDVRVHPTWFRSLVRALVAAGDRAVVSGRVTAEKPANATGFVPSTIEDSEPVVYEGRINIDILYSGNMILRRAAIDEIGLFDERLGGGAPFPTAEDNDFAHRLLEAGYRIHYAPDAAVEHRAWRTGRDYLSLRWRYGRGQGGFYAKHFDLRDRYMLRRAAHDASQRGVRFVRLVACDPRRAVGQIAYLAGLLSGIAQWLVTRPREP
jgi:GT2 family glycosyltransferase